MGKAAWVAGRDALTPGARALRLEHHGDRLRATTPLRQLLEETGLTAGDMTRIDVYSGPEFMVSYRDGYAAYVVGATFETSDVAGTLTKDDAGETAALAWCPVDELPGEINSYNRLILRRMGLEV